MRIGKGIEDESKSFKPFRLDLGGAFCAPDAHAVKNVHAPQSVKNVHLAQTLKDDPAPACDHECQAGQKTCNAICLNVLGLCNEFNMHYSNNLSCVNQLCGYIFNACSSCCTNPAGGRASINCANSYQNSANSYQNSGALSVYCPPSTPSISSKKK